MSFVSMVATENFLSVVSDGRVTDFQGTPIQEDFKKFIVPRNNTVIAFAGGKEPSIEFIATSGLLDADVDEITEIGFAKRINSKLLSSPLAIFKISLAFGGRNSMGQIAFHTFSSIEPRLQSFSPSGNNHISFSFLLNGDDVNFDLKDALFKTIESFGIFTPEAVVNSQKLLNNRVASIDDSVNENTFSHVIYR